MVRLSCFETDQTQRESEEEIETEQTKEVTKKRMFRLPCFEADQTQREAEEHFKTEQTKEVLKKRMFRLPFCFKW